jgi:hypothetical protein
LSSGPSRDGRTSAGILAWWTRLHRLAQQHNPVTSAPFELRKRLIFNHS